MTSIETYDIGTTTRALSNIGAPTAVANLQRLRTAAGLRVKTCIKAGAPSLSEIVVTKTTDCASSGLL